MSLPITQHLPLARLGLIEHVKEVFSFAVIFLDSAVSQQAMLNVLEKLKNDHAKTVVIISVRELVIHQTIIRLLKQYDNVILLLLGDLYGQTISENYSKFSKIIQNALIRRLVVMSENSLEVLFPIFLPDALEAIQHTLFRARKISAVQYLYYENPQTFIAVVNFLRRVEPELHMKSIENIEKKPGENPNTHNEIDHFLETVFHTKPVYIILDATRFEKSIQTMQKHCERQEQREKPKRIFRFLPKKITPPPSAWSFLASVITGIILYHAVIVGILAWQAQDVQKAYRAKDYTQTLEKAQSFSYTYQFIEPQLTTLTKSINNTFLNDRHTLLTYAHTSLLTSRPITQLVAQQKIPETEEELLSLQAHVLGAYFFLQQQRIDNSVVQNIFKESDIQDSLNYLSIQSILPTVAGYDKKKTYLLLFQNTGELRPSGGFIGSIGIASVENGTVDNLEIQDVYDIDGQLKAHVEPHFIVRRFLQPHLYLRDSSFSLDFEESASLAAQLYTLSTGKKVDGVVGLDFEAVRRVIEATGPINLPEYNKTITAQQAFEFLQSTIETNFFPGSSQKKDVLVALYNQLFLKLTEEKSLAQTTASLVPQLIAEKHILAAFEDPTIQKAFTAVGVSGSLRDMREKEKNTLYDTVGINEANIGVNKANAHIQRLIEHDVYLDKKSIEEQTTIHLINTSPNSVVYGAYIRLLTPADSSLTTITIDEQEQSIVPAVTSFVEYEKKTFKAPAGLEVDTQIIDDKKTHGFRVLVPQNTTQTITIRYTRNTPWNKEAYNLWYIKQPGTLAYPFALTIHYPDNMKVNRDSWNISGASANRNEVITKDRVYELNVQ